MKKLTTLLFGMAVAAMAMAVPAKRTPITVTQPDGTTITVMQMGDENYHYYVNMTTGEKLLREDTGFFRVATDAELATRKANANKRENISNLRRSARRAASTTYSALDPDGTTLDLHGQKRALVLLVSFSDKSFNSKNADLMPDQMNKVGYDENGHIGSAHDYFYSSSYGQFDLEIDVKGPYTVSNTMSYYGKNNSYGNDAYAAKMVAEACELAYNDSVDFSPYDWNGDGTVDMVTVIYAGYGEAQGASSSTIWPHQWYLSEAAEYGDGNGAVTLGGKTIDKYLVLNELTGTYGSTLDGIGTFCHEYSHSLGLPDIYDTNTNTGSSNTNFGMDTWSLMDYGCYNGDGCLPCAYTAYERAFCGWLTPTELTEGADINDMPALVDSAAAYIVHNEANSNEYYLLYNVQQKSWDQMAYGHGLIVMHVDYDEDVWYNNVVNNTASHQRCTIIHADNSDGTGSSDLAGDPYPGTSKNTSLTDTSTPKASLFNKNSDGVKLMHKAIEEITEDRGLISFKFNGGEQVFVEAPVGIAPTEIGDSSFTATWNPIADTEATYNLELTTKYEVDTPDPADVLLLSQDFKTLVAGVYQDVADNVDDYTSTPGWSGKKLYVQDGYMKIGSTNVFGWITTPSLHVTNGNVTVKYTAADYSGSDNFKYVFKLEGFEGDSIVVDKGNTIVNFTGVPEGDYKVTMGSTDTQVKNARFFLYDIAVYDGNFTEEDFNAAEEQESAPQRATRTKKVTLTGLTETSYTFTDLPSPCTCTYRVQAVDAGKHKSEWSEEVTVTLPQGTVDGIAATLDEKSSNGQCYDLQGRRINPSEMSRNQGIYIKNGKLYRF